MEFSCEHETRNFWRDKRNYNTRSPDVFSPQIGDTIVTNLSTPVDALAQNVITKMRLRCISLLLKS
jgi:hypothetical protein